MQIERQKTPAPVHFMHSLVVRGLSGVQSYDHSALPKTQLAVFWGALAAMSISRQQLGGR